MQHQIDAAQSLIDQAIAMLHESGIKVKLYMEKEGERDYNPTFEDLPKGITVVPTVELRCQAKRALKASFQPDIDPGNTLVK